MKNHYVLTVTFLLLAGAVSLAAEWTIEPTFCSRKTELLEAHADSDGGEALDGACS